MRSFKKDKIDQNYSNIPDIPLDNGLQASLNGLDINYNKSIADTDFFNKRIAQNNSAENYEDEINAANEYMRKPSMYDTEIEEKEDNELPDKTLRFTTIKSYTLSPGVVLLVSNDSNITESKIKAIADLLNL